MRTRLLNNVQQIFEKKSKTLLFCLWDLLPISIETACHYSTRSHLIVLLRNTVPALPVTSWRQSLCRHLKLWLSFITRLAEPVTNSGKVCRVLERQSNCRSAVNGRPVVCNGCASAFQKHLHFSCNEPRTEMLVLVMFVTQVTIRALISFNEVQRKLTAMMVEFTKMSRNTLSFKGLPIPQGLSGSKISR